MKIFQYIFYLGPFVLFLVLSSSLAQNSSSYSSACSKQTEIILRQAYAQSLLKDETDEKDLETLLCNTLYKFKDPSLLEQALTRRSYRNFLLSKKKMRPVSALDTSFTSVEDIKDNERLEFLGDSVIGLIAAQLLYEKSADMNEGIMSTKKSDLVSNVTLAKLGKAIGLDKVTFASTVEMKRSEKSVRFFSDTFEAYIGAIYEDSGHDISVVIRVFKEVLSLFDDKEIYSEAHERRDMRSELRNEVFNIYGVYPGVFVREIEDSRYMVSIYINGVLVDSNTGMGRKETEHSLIGKILANKTYLLVDLLPNQGRD